MIGFADPLLLLFVFAPIALRLLPASLDDEGAALSVPEGVARRLGGQPGKGSGSLPNTLLPVLIWICLVTAISGPRSLEASPALPVSGRDLVLALDLSGSMVREDFELDGQQIQRLAAVKHAAQSFVRGRAGDRVSLVIFGSRAYYAAAQTHDVEAIAAAIEGATIGIAGRATAISEGLGLALKRLRDSDATSKVVVLLSDGVNNSGPVKPRDAARLAKSLGVRVHTIALGPRDLETADGERDAVDAVTLQAVADLSGGEAFRVKTTDDLLAVTAAIDRLETNAANGDAALSHKALWTWPALAALLATLGIVARKTWP
jgi:Ca-activated chloride channel family protein